MDSAVILFLRSATLQISCQLHNQHQHTGASTAQQPHNFQHNQESSQDVVTSVTVTSRHAVSQEADTGLQVMCCVTGSVTQPTLH